MKASVLALSVPPGDGDVAFGANLVAFGRVNASEADGPSFEHECVTVDDNGLSPDPVAAGAGKFTHPSWGFVDISTVVVGMIVAIISIGYTAVCSIERFKVNRAARALWACSVIE